jgi:hypothetical protein
MASLSHSTRAPHWRTSATIEVDSSAGALDEVLCDIRFDCRLEAVPSPRADRLRFDLVVDTGRGIDRAARSAGMLLSALEAIAASGEFPGFRIVACDDHLRAGMPPLRMGSLADAEPAARTEHDR